MLRTSSWSISPPSNRSPGLSGAIARVVLQDDRRGEHRVGARPARRPAPATCPSFSHASAAARSAAGGSVSETNAPPVASQHGVGRAERPPQRLLAVAALPRRRVGDRHRQPPQPSADGARRRPRPPRRARCQRRIERAGAAAVGVAQVLALGARGDRRSPRAAAHARSSRQPGRRDLALDRLVPREVALAADRRARRPARARRPRRARRGADDVQEAHAHLDRRVRPPSSRHSVRIVHAVVGMRARCAPRG